MSDTLPPLTAQDLKDAEKALVEAINDVAIDGSGGLAGGTPQALTADTLLGLRESKVTFGYPTDHLVRLTPELFNAIGVELSAIRKQQMEREFDFFYMTLNVTMQPARGAQFTRLECSLEFGPDGGGGAPIVQTIFPSSQWKTVLNWGGGLNLGLNGNLDWSAGVDSPDQVVGLDIPANVKANIDNKNSMKSFVVVPDYSFNVGRSEVAATGEGNARCFWRIESPDLQQKQTYPFAVVFKTPKGTTSMTLEGIVAAEPDMNLVAANLRDVIDDIGQKIRSIFSWRNDERQGRDRLPLGSHERWTLPLPT